MLYHAYELNHAVLAPLREASELSKRLLQSPCNPLYYTIAGRHAVAAFDLFESVTRRYQKPEWGLRYTEIEGRKVPIKKRVIWQKPFCRLLHFQRLFNAELVEVAGAFTDDTNLHYKMQDSSSPLPKAQPRVLLVAPLSGHYATLLRQTVDSFLPDHEVYVTDWTDARTVPLADGAFDLNDYVDYIIEILKVLGPDCHVIGICQPGPPVLSAIAYMAENKDDSLPASMTFMGSPIDTRLSPTTPNQVASERSYQWFRDNMIYSVPWPNPGVMRRVYPGFLQLGGFITMNQDRHVQAHKDYFEHLVEGDCDSVQKHREFYDEYLAVLDLTEEFYLQTIRDVFQEHKLPRGIFTHRGSLIKPECIKSVALMTVEGERDDISGIGQTQAAHAICSGIPENMHVDYVQEGVGHYGVFSGSRYREHIQPRMRDFILRTFNQKKEQRLQDDNPPLIM